MAAGVNSAWKGLYRVGGIAFIISGILYFLALGAFATIATGLPTTLSEEIPYVAAHALILEPSPAVRMDQLDTVFHRVMNDTRRDRRKAWRRHALNKATREHDFRPSWVIIYEAGRRRDERMRLFGYVKWRTGEIISLDEAQGRIRETLKEYPDKKLQDVINEFVLEWHDPEAYRDVVDSIGEVDCKKDTYPALGLSSGDVLGDPKLRYRHPALTV